MPDSFTHGCGSSRAVEREYGSWPIRVLVANLHVTDRRGLSDIIDREQDMVSCGQAVTVEEIFRVLAEENPQVAVLDFSLDEGLDIDLVEDLRAQYPCTQLVIFSMQDERDYAEQAIKAGAVSYVMKSDSTAHLVDAIRFAARQEVYLSRRILTMLLRKHAREEESALRLRFAIDELTDREIEVFRSVGRGKTVADIARQLQLERSTVSTYQRRVRRKLGLDTITELRQFAVQWMMASRHVN